VPHSRKIRSWIRYFTLDATKEDESRRERKKNTYRKAEFIWAVSLEGFKAKEACGDSEYSRSDTKVRGGFCELETWNTEESRERRGGEIKFVRGLMGEIKPHKSCLEEISEHPNTSE